MSIRNAEYGAVGKVEPVRDAGEKNLFPLKNKIIPRYKRTVVLGGELAVPSTRNPLYAGLNSPSRILSTIPVVLIGRRATDTHEPCQVRKEAAISDGVCVADRSRSVYGALKGKGSTRGCTTIFHPVEYRFRPRTCKTIQGQGNAAPHAPAGIFFELEVHDLNRCRPKPGTYGRDIRRIPGIPGGWSGHAIFPFWRRSGYFPLQGNQRSCRRWRLHLAWSG